MKKRPHITDQTNKDFAEAYLRIVQEKNKNMVTVQDIIDRAGYKRSTFYQHFKNIYELEEYAKDFLKLKYSSDKNNIVKNAYILNTETMAQDIKLFIEANRKNLTLQGSEISNKIFKENFVNPRWQAFHTAVGRLNKKDEDQFRLIMTYHLYGAFNQYVEYANSDSDISLEEFAEMFTQMHTYGVIPMLKKIK